MGILDKGIVASKNKNIARIIPDGTEKSVSVIIPSNLRDDRNGDSLTEKIKVGDSVLYVSFTDGDAVIICRMDGEYNG